MKVAKALRLQEWEIGLRYYPGYPSFKPFEGWDVSSPTKSLPWYDSYNAVKHDRESKFQQATLRNMLAAIGAAFVMAYAQFGQFGHDDDTDEFSVVSFPSWPLAEHYVPPRLAFEKGASWKPVDFEFV